MSTTTVFYADLIIQAMRGLPVNINEDATLNEIIPGVVHKLDAAPAGERPILEYYMVGSAGHQIDCATQSISDAARSPLSAVLYGSIPLKVVDVDVSPGANYRLKVRKAVEGVDKDFYFMRRVPAGTATDIVYNIRDTGDLLNPTPFDTTVPGNIDFMQSTTPPDAAALTLAANKIVTVDHDMPITLSESEFEDIRQAYAQYHFGTGAPELTIISEIAACTGIEGPNDVISAQLGSVMNELIRVSSGGQYKTHLNIGTKDAMYVTT